ncbi:exodeoxyribonuclease VII large subunit [Nitrospinae bacterium]|nr:exodeoxyribonuclease VII large subunit [Nitrospinota bacterium]
MIQNRQAQTKKQSSSAKKSDSFLDKAKPVSQEGGPQVYQVSELTRDIKAIMEAAFDSVWVEGEISNFNTAVSGHSYFDLKDKNSLIRCVLWKGQRPEIKFQPEDGDKVLLFGRITIYGARGNYQIVTESMEPRGLGALQKAFEQLKIKLEKEGLFDEDKKKSLPEFPWKIGIVTSSTGAAVRDILNIIRRRNPKVSVLLCPAKVQGEGAAEEIATGIKELNKRKDIEVIIVGRGGGSLEDLWAFNEELVARAITASCIPVVSAVGHEIDFTISDFVADLRAPTPSAAAELTVPLLHDTIQDIKTLNETLINTMQQKLRYYYDFLKMLMDRRFFHQPKEIFYLQIQRVDELHSRLLRGLEQGLMIQQQKLKDKIHRLFQASPDKNIPYLKETLGMLEKRMLQIIQTQILIHKERLEGLLKNLNAFNPLSILDRGYSISSKDNLSLKDTERVNPGDSIQIRLSKGSLDCTVKKIIRE